MILADTSVWVEFFRDTRSAETALLEAAVRDQTVLMGDLILVEVLQGLRTQSEERKVAAAFAQLENVTLCGPTIAPLAAANYRALRRAGITVRGTIDVIIATWCIANRVALLHVDRDFVPIEKHLGLRMPQ
jgi:predicted nucleic acid-binding protein